MTKKKRKYRKPSYTAALRMARIAFELPGHPFGWPLDAIRRELGISDRTLKRYLAAARDSLVDRLGRPYFVLVANGQPKLRLPPSQRPLQSSAFQLVSLHFTLTVLKFLEGTVLEKGVEELWDRFSKSLPAYERADLGTLDRKFYSISYAPKDYRGLNHLLDPIIRGLVREYRLRIEYLSGLVHEVDPYTLVAYRGGLYLIGRTHINDTITTLAVERMRRVELLPGEGGGFRKFAYPASFRPERYTEGAFGIMVEGGEPVEVELLVKNRETETYLRARSLHPSQRFIKRRGKTVLTMKVRGTTELRNWILGFGPWLEVLKPAALRQEVSALLSRAARNYRA